MIHDVVMAVVLKICSIFIFILKIIIIIMIFMIVSKKMVLHCTLARLGSKMVD